MDPARNIYCQGKLVSLRPPSQEDIDAGWTDWLNNEETTRFLADRYWPNSSQMQRHYYESLQTTRDRLALSIIHNESGKLIGTGSLSQIHYVHRYAHIAVIIGERQYQKGPVAIEAYNLFLKVAFIRLNLRTVMSVSASAHSAVHAIHKVLGFVQHGRIPNLWEIGGEYCDVVFSSVDREKWKQCQ